MAFLLFLGGLIVLRKQFWLSGKWPVFPAWRIFRSRRFMPKIWLALTIMAFIGGLIHHATNYDYLTYRLPRILHWCWEQKWYWVETSNIRINLSATGFEWMMAPLFILFHTDRPVFLINFLSYLLLPGLVFSVFYHLGISKRVSWWWMWVLPSGYCYILQAASAGNDSYAAVYFLASLDYALRAKNSFSIQPRRLVLSLLAVALLTGVKVTNMPLMLPWLTAVFLNRKPLLAGCRPVILMLALVAAAGVSFFPTALLNIHFTGDFSGDPHNIAKAKLSNPISGIVGNSLELAANNLAPPLWYKAFSLEGFIPARVKKSMESDFPRLVLTVGEMPIEEGAGIGLGVMGALAFMMILRSRTPFPQFRQFRHSHRDSIWIIVASLIAFLIYMGKIGSESTARLLAAYYPLMIAGILLFASLDGVVIRRTFCKIVGVLVILSAVPLVVLNPARPLFPTGLVLDYLSRSGASPTLLLRGHQVYDVYASRYDDFKDFREAVPGSENVVGFLHIGDDPEVSLWLPYGSRQVVDVTPEETAEEIEARHIHFIVVDAAILGYKYQMTLDDLLRKWSGTVVLKKNLVIKIQRGPELWYLIHCP